MAAIGSVWASGSWVDDGWIENSWATAVEAEEVEYVGKYKMEHDMALADIGAARGFSAEHASALRDVGAAGR